VTVIRQIKDKAVKNGKSELHSLTAGIGMNEERR
jgi:hypothetical protein